LIHYPTAYKDTFALFDKGLLVANLYQTYTYLLTQSDGNGTITTAELGSVMRAVGRNPTEQDLQKILKEIDKDNSGSIEFDEFVELMERTFTDQETPDELLQAFNLFDKDGNGNIDLSELGQVMESLG
jgi:calmodulin